MRADPGHRQVAPLTVITPIPRWASWLQRALLAIFRWAQFPAVREFSVIHFARWQVIRRHRIARANPLLPPEARGDDYLLFASNFDGSWEQYIDGFGTVRRIKRGVRWIWWLSRGFPGPWPLGQFKRYIRHFEAPADFYYCAYGDASVKDIQRALQLDYRLENFLAEQTDTLDDAEFELRYASFLNDITPHLSVAAVAFEPASGNSLPGEEAER